MLFAGYLLSALIWLPIFGGIAALMVGGDRHANRARVIALITALVSLVLCIPLCTHFDPHTAQMQFTEHHMWIRAYNIHYDLGVDGISMPLIVLTAFTTLLVVIAGWRTINLRVGQYMASFLVMQGTMIGAFAATDSMLFYVFWEAILIPMYLSIGIWGSTNRSYASIKFFLYTFLGSALMLVVILYLSLSARSF